MARYQWCAMITYIDGTSLATEWSCCRNAGFLCVCNRGPSKLRGKPPSSEEGSRPKTSPIPSRQRCCCLSRWNTPAFSVYLRCVTNIYLQLLPARLMPFARHSGSCRQQRKGHTEENSSSRDAARSLPFPRTLGVSCCRPGSAPLAPTDWGSAPGARAQLEYNGS